MANASWRGPCGSKGHDNLHLSDCNALLWVADSGNIFLPTTLQEIVMGKAELEALKKAALELPESERANLASELVASLDGPGEIEAAAAWDIEICRRINEIAAGTAEVFDVDDVLKRARARLVN